MQILVLSKLLSVTHTSNFHFKDLTLFGKLDFGGGQIHPTDEGIPIVTDRSSALDIHSKIVC